MRPRHHAAIEYIESIPHVRWATYAFPLPRYGQLTSNSVEQSNKWLLQPRGQPVVNLLQGIYDLMMEQWVKRHRASLDMKKSLVPTATKSVKAIINQAALYNVTLSLHNHESARGKVWLASKGPSLEFERETYIYWGGIASSTCTCGDVFQLGLPC